MNKSDKYDVLDTLIGVPWTVEHNCWWVVREAYRMLYATILPPLITYSEATVARVESEIGSRGFIRSYLPREGAIMLCRDFNHNRHAGVVLEWSGVLHLLHSESVRAKSVELVPLHQVPELMEVEYWRQQ